MAFIDARTIPADQTSVDRLAENGLDYRLVDFQVDAQSAGYQRAVSRGFLGSEPTAESLADERETFAGRRNTGVYDRAAGAEALPVATVNSWVTPLTIPGSEIAMWAISVVTVAGTHRRRGIARALLEGELRAAAAAGVPIAGLTVSEATIYGRYGFGAAVPAARLSVDTRRAGWAGHVPGGTVEYVEREELSADLGTVHERARRLRSGSIPGWKGRWDGYAGLSASDTDKAKVRGVRYRDETGEVRGVLVYTLNEIGGTFRSALQVRLLVGESPDAVAALWRFALQHDLVDEVTADLRPLDDPLPWLVADARGVTQTVHDHGWLRVLDVPAALTARGYSAALDLVIRIEDSLDFAAGDWRVQIDAEGTASVEKVDGQPVDARMSVAALSSLYAGAVRAESLRGAGLIEAGAATVEALDRAFISFPAPSLDIWY